MSTDTRELSPLVPDVVEILISLAVLTHIVLLITIVVLVMRRKMAVPYGPLGYLVLFLLTLLGPLLVIVWNLQRARLRTKAQRLAQ